MLLADTPTAFAAEVLRLIADLRSGAPLSTRLGANARRFVEERYGWATIIPHFDRLYEGVQDAKGA